MSIQPAVPRVANVTRFFRALHMIESYRLNYPQAQAQVFLEEMRETVRTSAATSEEREMFASVQEMYDWVIAEENARRSGEHEPLKAEASKTTTEDDKEDEDPDKTVDLTSPESKSLPQDPPADADA